MKKSVWPSSSSSHFFNPSSVSPRKIFFRPGGSHRKKPNQVRHMERHIGAVGLGQVAQQAVCHLHLYSNFCSPWLKISRRGWLHKIHLLHKYNWNMINYTPLAFHLHSVHSSALHLIFLGLEKNFKKAWYGNFATGGPFMEILKQAPSAPPAAYSWGLFSPTKSAESLFSKYTPPSLFV